MLTIPKAVAFIESRGTSIEIARMNSILGSTVDNKKALLQINQLQSIDGGFSLQVGTKSSISDTGFIMTWLSDLKSLQSGIAKQAIKYLESEQNNDGSWNEKVNNEENTPEWRESNMHKAILYQTANTLFWLSNCSLNRKCIEKGLYFLHENYQAKNEYIHTKWLYASILSREYSWKDEMVKKMVEEVVMEMAGNMPASMKTWMLCSFALYGIENNDARLINMINEIKQDQNGSIESEDADSYGVNATLELLKVYKYYIDNANEISKLTTASS